MFITFEGIDGSGKTTQIKLLKEELIKENFNVEVFREPGGTAISEKVRELLLKDEFEVHPVTELLLFSAARAQLVAEKILPLLQKETIVILDRFFDSTIAYQGFGRQLLSESEIEKISRIATQNLVPDITFYLNISLREAQKRTQLSSGDRIERSGEDFYKRVIHGYDTLSEQEERIKKIDTSVPVEKAHLKIMQFTESILKK